MTIDITKVRPLSDQCLVRRDAPDKKRGSILIPDTAQEKVGRGVIEKAGPGRVTKDGFTVAMTVKPGDHVYFANWVPCWLNTDGTNRPLKRHEEKMYPSTTVEPSDDFVMVKERDMYFIVEPDNAS